MRRDLVEGYLYEVTKSLSRRDRNDVRQRLETEIYDEIDRTKKENIETKEEVLRVLEGYGNPADVAAKYSTSKKRGLVPQPHFGHYVKDKWMSFIVGLLVIGALYAFNYLFMETLPLNISLVLDVLAKVGILFLVVYISYTLAFSFVSGSRLPSWKSFSSHLKPEPTKSSRVSAFEIGFQVILSTLLFTAFALGSDLLGLNFGNLNVGLYSISIFGLFVLAFFINVLNITYKEVDKRYTFSVMATTILTNLAVIGLAFLIFVQNDSIGANFRDWLVVVSPSNDLMTNIINNIGLVIFLVIALFAVIDTISTGLGYHSNTKDSIEPIFKEDKAERDLYTTSEDFTEDSYHNISDTPVDVINEPISSNVDLEDRELKGDKVEETIVVENIDTNESYYNEVSDDTMILEKANDDMVLTQVPSDEVLIASEDTVDGPSDEVIVVNEDTAPTPSDEVFEEPKSPEDLTPYEEVLVEESDKVMDNADDEFITQKINRNEFHKELKKHQEVFDENVASTDVDPNEKI